jgi:hypothetical protein
VGDVLAVKPGNRPLLLQCTSGSHHAARLNKARQEPRLRAWLASGATFAVWSWSKADDRWQCRKTPVELDDCDGLAVIEPPRRQRRPQERGLFDRMILPAGDKAADKSNVGGGISSHELGVCEVQQRVGITLAPQTEETAA